MSTESDRLGRREGGGPAALARLLERSGLARPGDDPDMLANDVWPDFVAAVAAAQAELREERPKRWRE